jgi:hypothetical protein
VTESAAADARHATKVDKQASSASHCRQAIMPFVVLFGDFIQLGLHIFSLRVAAA